MLTDVGQSRLANGVRVITSSLPHVASVSIGIWVGVGARYEAGRVSGISHFIEHLLFKGTRRRSPRDISRAIEGRGGYLNAFTQEESTCYYARVTDDQLPKAFDVLADMYMHPRFDAADIDKERGVILEEIMMYRDQPHHVVQELLGQALWQRHALGRPVIGSPETLGRMTRRDIQAFKQRGYAPGNTVVAAAGRLDHDRCAALVARAMRGLRKRSVPGCRSVTERVGQSPIVIERRDIEQVHLAIGFRLFGRDDERRYALRVLNAVLGENMSSRLFQVVREKHGLAYSVHSSCHLYRDSGALVISAGLDRHRYRRAQELTLRELARLKNRPVGAGELKQAKDYVIGQTRLGLESTSQQMMWVGDGLLSRGRFVPPDEAIAKLAAVTAEDVQSVARDVLLPSRASFAMVAPEAREDDRTYARDLLARL